MFTSESFKGKPESVKTEKTASILVETQFGMSPVSIPGPVTPAKMSSKTMTPASMEAKSPMFGQK